MKTENKKSRDKTQVVKQTAHDILSFNAIYRYG